MEQDEILPENPTVEQDETDESSSVTVGEPSSENKTEDSITMTGKSVDQTVTNPMATIKIEGQEFDLEVKLAENDQLLKTILQPHYASVENAAITKEVKDGKLIVSIVKKAQPKGWD